MSAAERAVDHTVDEVLVVVSSQPSGRWKQMIRDLVEAGLADGWDEGAERGFDSHAPEDLTDVQAENPYRRRRGSG